MTKIKIILLSLLLTNQFIVKSQSDIDTSLTFDKIIINQNRFSIPLNENARHIDIISKQDIVLSPAQSIQELLQYAGAVDLRQRGVNGVQSDIGMRGSSFNQVLILIDGVKLTDPQTGHHNMNLPINLNDVERIEIIKGPAARIYGQNALAGVINIITKSAYDQDELLNVNASFASFNTFNMGLKVAIPSKYYDQTLSLNRIGSDGYKYNTDYQINGLNYQSTIKLSDKYHIDINSGISLRKFGANGFYANEKFIDQYEEILTNYASVSSNIVSSNWVIKPRFSWRRNNDDYVFLRDDPSYYNNIHTSNTYSGEIHTTYQSKYGITGLGVDVTQEELNSNNLGLHSRNNIGFSIEHRLEILNNKLGITIGTYSSKFSDDQWRFSPGIDANYSLTEELSVFGLFNAGTRLPTYTNLYYTSAAEQGNEDLEPEFSKSFELGIRNTNPLIQSTLSGFYKINDNLIDWAKDSINQDKWVALNFNEVIMKGIDLSNKINISRIIGIDHFIQLNVDYTYIDAQVNDQQNIAISRYALDNLKHQLITGLTFDLWPKKIKLNTNFRYFDRVSLDNYSLVNTKLVGQFDNFSCFIAINNLFDEQYKETNLVTMPGRAYSIGFSL